MPRSTRYKGERAWRMHACIRALEAKNRDKNCYASLRVRTVGRVRAYCDNMRSAARVYASACQHPRTSFVSRPYRAFATAFSQAQRRNFRNFCR